MFLLDTNILSELVRRAPDPSVELRFESEPGALCTSVICLEEIRFGTRIGPRGTSSGSGSNRMSYPMSQRFPSICDALSLRATSGQPGRPQEHP